MGDNIITPPYRWHLDGVGQLIFLAGPIISENDWQARAASILHTNNPSLFIANPRQLSYPSPEELLEKIGSDDKFMLQTSWETGHIRMASATGGIMFWLANESYCDVDYGRESLFQLAEWITHMKYRKINKDDRKLKLSIGIENGFPGAKYIVHRIYDDCPGINIANTLEETCEQMLEQLNELDNVEKSTIM